jgi:hypothetical protein
MLKPLGITLPVLHALIRIGQAAQDAFTRGVTGKDFAAACYTNVITAHGEEAIDFICRFGKDNLQAWLGQLPGVKLPDTPEFHSWLNDFFAACEPEGDPDAEG